MTNIELYIDKKLCDIQSPEKLGVRLNRVLINPAELSSKDAQYSYSITIPSTPDNDAIFGYANVEEVKNKFNHHHTAQLYVDSIRIFDGRFKLSEIDSEGNYKGNLVVPAKKTIKEIFGDKKMTEIKKEWSLDVSDPLNRDNALSMVDMLNKFNTDKGTPECIFPLVLYGLLPKVPKDKEGNYSEKTVWDKYVRLGILDFPPSINCLQMIRKIFENYKDDDGNLYRIGGSAFDDPRLAHLYMSYQNPTNYEQEWNWGHLGKFEIKGSWTNYKNGEGNINRFEQLYSKNDDGGRWNHFYSVNLFRSSMTELEYVKDQGTNVFCYTTEGTDYKNVNITIPQSGLYKIQLDTTLRVRISEGNKSGEKDHYIGVENELKMSENQVKKNNFSNSRYEVKLLRDFGEGSFDMDDSKFDGTLYRDNLPQDSNIAKTRYFPVPGSECVQMIDPMQNEKLISGFRWGEYGKTKHGKPFLHYEDPELAPNPLEEMMQTPSAYKYCRIMAIRHGWSWDTKFSQKNKIYSAINSPAYSKITGVDPEDESENVGLNIMSDLFKVELKNGTQNSIRNTNNLIGDGKLSQVIWLDKGEHLTLVGVTSSGHDRGKEGWMIHDIDFTLKVEPFRKEPEWIKIGNKGTGTASMKWDDVSDFKKKDINLFKFLPSEQKIDEWLNNFCKAFNLELLQPEEHTFELNVKRTRSASAIASVIDLDGKASIAKRTNQPLGLPSAFQLGFKINKDEQGYIEFKSEDGGGSYTTGNIDGQVITQSSNFSYNWFKYITRNDLKVCVLGDGGGIVTLKLPVITHKEIWSDALSDYAEKQKKLHTNYSQRFWYKNGEAYNVGIVWANINGKLLSLPQLDNSLSRPSIMSLDYYDEPDSILNTYFSIIATDDSNYTYIECYLTPDEYEQLDGTKLVELNGDLYYIASVEGYDPMGRNKTKLKLIRKV